MAKSPLSERKILELDDAATRPAWANPALSKQSADRYEISVAGLYWGFTMLHSLVADKNEAKEAELLARTLYF